MKRWRHEKEAFAFPTSQLIEANSFPILPVPWDLWTVMDVHYLPFPAAIIVQRSRIIIMSKEECPNGWWNNNNNNTTPVLKRTFQKSSNEPF
jgi:hypothetical protein